MTIKKIIRTGKLSSCVTSVKEWSCVNISFLDKDNTEQATQLNVDGNLLTKNGEKKLSDLFDSLVGEFETTKDSVLGVEIVASADTNEKLIAMGF